MLELDSISNTVITSYLNKWKGASYLALFFICAKQVLLGYWFKDFTIEIMNAAYGKMVAKYLGETYINPIETIHYALGVIDPKDKSGNMNVKKLIKPSCKTEELEDAFTRLKSRVTSKQMKRQFKWDVTRYQISKVTRYEINPAVTNTSDSENIT